MLDIYSWGFPSFPMLCLAVWSCPLLGTRQSTTSPYVTQFSFMASHYFPTQTLVLSTMTLSQYLSFLGLPFIYRVSVNLLVHLSTC